MSAASGRRERHRGEWLDRVRSGLLLLVLSAALLAAVGTIGHFLLHWVLLTTTLGPTAYVLFTQTGQAEAGARGAATGHAVAVAVGLGCLAVFGLWSHPSVPKQQHDTMRQVGAQALAVGVTLFFLHVLGTHHAPAAATALLVASGIARPGPALYGMLIGLAIVLIVAPPLARIHVRPTARR